MLHNSEPVKEHPPFLPQNPGPGCQTTPMARIIPFNPIIATIT